MQIEKGQYFLELMICCLTKLWLLTQNLHITFEHKVNIRSEQKRPLGAALGSVEIQKEFEKDHIKKNNEQLITLSTAAETQPGCLSE